MNRTAVIIEKCGPLKSPAEVATLLGVGEAAVRNRITEGTLIGFSRGDKIRLPAWQFASGEVRPWVHSMIEAFGDNALGLINFLVAPRRSGVSYLEMIDAGKLEEVLTAAKRTNPD